MKIPKNSKIMLDTSPIIYYIEDIEPYASVLQNLFNSIANGDNTAVTSVVTFIEVLTKPIRDKNLELEEKFRLYFANSKNIELVSITPDIGEQSAILRAKYALRTPDAIQIAVAINSESVFFITNDRIFEKITEMKVIMLDDLIR